MHCSYQLQNFAMALALWSCVQGQCTISPPSRTTCPAQETEMILNTLNTVLIPTVQDIHKRVSTEALQPFPVVDDEDVDPRNTYLYPRTCADLYKSGRQESGVHTVYTFVAGLPVPFHVWCDMDTAGGGWMVFQRRMDGSVDFYRTWRDYVDGFGNITGEYWLGNRMLHLVTVESPQTLRVDLEDADGITAYATYDTFHVASEKDLFSLTVDSYHGNAGDSLVSQDKGVNFTTKDKDNDWSSNNCAKSFEGAWWYTNCYLSNLNGQYRPPGNNTGVYEDDSNLSWVDFRGHGYSLKKTEMKMRPNHY